jgi:hypothetical protein
MLYVRASLILILVGFAGVANATDLDLSLTTTAGYDDNIFRTDKNTKDDASFRFGPTVRIRDETSKASYNVSYNPVYEKFVSWTEADEWSHFANGALDYQLSDRTLVSLSENFRFAQSLNRGPLTAQRDATGSDIEFVPNTEIRREDVYLNTASASVFHNFTAHTQGEFTVSHNFYDSDERNTSKNNVVSGFANVMHTLSARDQVGLGGGATWQRFDGVRGQPQTDTFIFRVTGSWIHNFGQDTELTLQGGPAVIYTDQESGRTGSVDQYPHQLVTNAKSVANAYATIGLSVPADVMYLNDLTPVDPDDLLGSGSVLIPEAGTCQMSGVGGETVFDRSNCSYNVIVNSTEAADYDGGGISTAIATTKTPPLNYVSGNGGGSDTEVTAFGEASISHHWLPELSSRASFIRSAAGATSLGSSTVSDHAMFETIWNPTRRWDLQVRGDWLRRKSPNDISNTYVVVGTDINVGGAGPHSPIVSSTDLVAATINNTVDTEYWRVSGRAAYRTSRRSTVTLRASYQHQDTDRGSSRSNSSFENVLVILGFRYDLDPFHF